MEPQHHLDPEDAPRPLEVSTDGSVPDWLVFSLAAHGMIEIIAPGRFRVTPEGQLLGKIMCGVITSSN